MATFVLVHGGGHGGWCWQRLTPHLRAAGHEVHTPTLTGVGERVHLLGPDVGLDTHVEDVVAVLKYEDLRDVILVGHSYGGMVITGVADRAPTRVGHLVYLDTAAPSDGQSMVDLVPDLMSMARSMSKTVDGIELVLNYMPEAGRLYGVTDEAALEGPPGAVDAPPLEDLRGEPALRGRDGGAAHPEDGHHLLESHVRKRTRPRGTDGWRRPGLRDRHGPRPHDHRARASRPAPATTPLALSVWRRGRRPCSRREAWSSARWLLSWREP